MESPPLFGSLKLLTYEDLKFYTSNLDATAMKVLYNDTYPSENGKFDYILEYVVVYGGPDNLAERSQGEIASIKEFLNGYGSKKLLNCANDVYPGKKDLEERLRYHTDECFRNEVIARYNVVESKIAETRGENVIENGRPLDKYMWHTLGRN